MKIHTNPIATNGQITIGYDDDGVAGLWPGCMQEAIEDGEFLAVEEGHEFDCQDGTFFDASMEGEEMVWKNEVGGFMPIRELLRSYGSA